MIPLEPYDLHQNPPLLLLPESLPSQTVQEVAEMSPH